MHTAYSYDDNDRLTQQGGVTYAYDANGNTLTETEDGLVTARYTYNTKNKLLAVTKAGETTSFGYNPDGIRTRKAGSGAKQVSYVYGDDLLSQARAGDVGYYVYDGQGSVRSLTNQTGVQTEATTTTPSASCCTAKETPQTATCTPESSTMHPWISIT
ncbi:Rhs family protein [Hahella chejuensis KCTC 2396]|uniref:Rhs family protein n=1 Tax=Hahella chejuensis (strain KCTC 2396) TaxID=349521 RepID=Q2SKA4_HAHCH|nr:Rhs family protein [Hahella chejuensis]ABC28920.1 Rhs family protein [Hahella chejuensis KCTC 2396]